jgi:hypothetical protein
MRVGEFGEGGGAGSQGGPPATQRQRARAPNADHGVGVEEAGWHLMRDRGWRYPLRERTTKGRDARLCPRLQHHEGSPNRDFVRRSAE